MGYVSTFVDVPAVQNDDCKVVLRILEPISKDPALRMYYGAELRDISKLFDATGRYISPVGNVMRCKGIVTTVGLGSAIPFDSNYIQFGYRLSQAMGPSVGQLIQCVNKMADQYSLAYGQKYIGNLQVDACPSTMDAVFSIYNRVIIERGRVTPDFIVGYALIVPKTTVNENEAPE